MANKDSAGAQDCVSVALLFGGALAQKAGVTLSSMGWSLQYREKEFSRFYKWFLKPWPWVACGPGMLCGLSQVPQPRDPFGILGVPLFSLIRQIP